jgi:hypothetical protein
MVRSSLFKFGPKKLLWFQWPFLDSLIPETARYVA